jgi:hypothetical protein
MQDVTGNFDHIRPLVEYLHSYVLYNTNDVYQTIQHNK